MSYIYKSAKSYLSSIPSHIKLSEYPLTKMDANKLNVFLKDYSVFQGLNMSDVAFITKKLDTINLFRGCTVGCLHCLRNAVAPKKNRETILFEDLRQLLNAFHNLSERLGFDILNGNKFLNIADDSEPMNIPIKGIKEDHGISEVIRLIYKKLGIPVSLTTSGWESKMDRSIGYQQQYKTAKWLVQTAKTTPDAIKEIQVSINPFQPSESYANRMANTLYAFLDLFKLNKVRIIYKHSKDNLSQYGADAAKKLYEEIYAKLQILADSKLECFPELKPEIVTKISKNNWIQPSGRGRKFISEQENKNLQEKFENEFKIWQGMSPKEQYDTLLNKSRKFIDIDGSIYVSKPTNIFYTHEPIEVTVPTDIKLNFINQEKPNKIFSDVDL